jgi:hypothetical protein
LSPVQSPLCPLSGFVVIATLEVELKLSVARRQFALRQTDQQFAACLDGRNLATADEAFYAGRTFGGVSVSSGDVLVMYTYAGDLNLDGLVDAADYGIIDNFVQFPGSFNYAKGDINYDGVIDAVDYGIIDNTIQLQGPPIPTSAGFAGSQGVTPVPEPGGVALVIASLTCVLGCRRRQRRRHRGGACAG